VKNFSKKIRELVKK